jgi:hypothetical protein
MSSVFAKSMLLATIMITTVAMRIQAILPPLRTKRIKPISNARR